MHTSFISFLRDIRKLLETIVGERGEFYCLLLLILLAVVMRIIFLHEPMRYDESSSFLLHSSKPFTYALSYYIGPGNHLFHTFLSRIAYLLLGNEPWVLRLPAFIAGILLIPVSFIVMRILFNTPAALLTAGLTCSSSVLIVHSTNARGYSLICLFFFLILGLGAYLKTRQNASAWLLFTLFSALGFYTIPIMLYPFGIVSTWLLLSSQPGARLPLLKNICVSVFFVLLLTILLYAPVITLSGINSIIANPVVRPLLWADFTRRFLTPPAGIWELWMRDVPIILMYLLIAGFGISLLLYKKIAPHSISLVLATAIFLLPALFIHRVVPPPRVWLFLLPLYLGLSASGLACLWDLVPCKNAKGKSFTFILLTILISFILCYHVIHRAAVHYNEYATFRDGEDVARFLNTRLHGGDRILAFTSVNMPLRYYLHKTSGLEGFLYADIDSCRRLIVIENYATTGPRETVEDILSKGGVQKKEWTAPQPIKRFSFSSVYELRRLPLAQRK